jgi:hypothetical protein
MAPATARLDLIWRLGALAAALAGWVALAVVLSSPSEAASSVLWGYSASRLLLAFLLLLPAAVFTWVSLRWRKLASLVSLAQRRLSKFGRPLLILSLLAFVFSLSWSLLFLPQDRAIKSFGSFSLYITELKPFFLFFCVVLLVAFVLVWATSKTSKQQIADRLEIRIALYIFAAFALAVAIIALTRIGLGFDATIWNAPGSPLVGTQVVVAFLGSAALLGAFSVLRRRLGQTRLQRIDWILAGVVWLVAAVMWLHEPAQPTYYSSEPRYPNFESYPVSDAFNHDVIAQNVLIGEGFHFGGLVAIRRPLYVLFLSALEGLLASNYSAVVNAQVVVLALFPALLYLLAARLHNRFSGLLLGGLVVFRETNSIALGHVINASHAKLLMADLPTALGMALLAVVAVVWLRSTPRNYLAALLTGSLLGAFVLLRSQSLTLIPVFALLVILVWGWRAGWKAVLLFFLGAVLVVSPWVVRNRIGMGQWAIEDSIVSGFLANRYRYEPGTFGLPFLDGESEGEYYARQMAAVREFALSDPVYVAGFVSDNFVRNQLLNLMALPVSFELRELELHVRQLPFWPSWDGSLPSESYLPIAANLALVSLGLAVAWRGWRWVGLVPLFINLGFTANLALARVSGWRYNLPADWVVLLYYAMGLSQIALWVFSSLTKSPAALNSLVTVASKSKTKTGSTWMAIGFGLLLLVGFSFSIIETLSTPRYEKLQAQTVLQELEELPLQEARLDALKTMLGQNGLDILNGRALYPAFYSAGEGVPGSTFALNVPQEFDRLTFFLIGPEAASISFPFEKQNVDLPSAAHVVVLRCSSHSPTALAVILPEQKEVLFSSDFDEGCSE